MEKDEEQTAEENDDEKGTRVYKIFWLYNAENLPTVFTNCIYYCVYVYNCIITSRNNNAGQLTSSAPNEKQKAKWYHTRRHQRKSKCPVKIVTI